MKIKVIVNKCYGGLTFSKVVFDKLGLGHKYKEKYGGIDNSLLGIISEDPEAFRTDKRLIECIESIGEKESSGPCASIRILEFDVRVDIEDFEGMESVAFYGYEV